MGVVPTLDKTEKGDASLGLGAKGIAINEFAFQRSKENSRTGALSKQSPAEPIDGRTPAALQRWPKAMEVYWQP